MAEMADLKAAAIGIRKAAALYHGISTGSFEPVLDNNTDKVVLARVFNPEHPDGIEITLAQVEYAIGYTWAEIKKRS